MNNKHLYQGVFGFGVIGYKLFSTTIPYYESRWPELPPNNGSWEEISKEDGTWTEATKATGDWNEV